jgi:periplasmic copper chaperone A
MTRFLLTPLFLFAALSGLASCDRQTAAPEITVTDVWARATAPGQTTGAAYMTITNQGGADRLVSAKASISPASALHKSETAGGVTSMAMVDTLDIPASATVRLEPGGTHLMIMDLSTQLRPGDRFFVDLNFEKSGTRTIGGKVVAAGAR